MSVTAVDVDQGRSKHWFQYILLTIAIVLMLVLAAKYGQPIVGKYMW